MNLSTIYKRLFRIDLDAYFLYRQPVGKHESDKIELPAGYTFIEISLSEFDHNIIVERLADCVRINRLEYMARLKCGDRCFALEYEAKVIAIAWVGYESSAKRKSFAALLSKFKPGLLAYDEFVDPLHRGKKLQVKLRNLCFSEVDDVDYEYWYVFVGVKNMASLINTQQLYPERKLIYHLAIEIPKFKFNLYPKYNNEPWVELS